MRGFAEHQASYSFPPDEFNEFNNTGTQLQDSFYHMTLKLHFISDICTKTSRFRS